MRKKVFICLFVFNCICVFCQDNTGALSRFTAKFNQYEQKDEIDSMFVLLSSTFYTTPYTDLTKIQKQYCHYYSGRYYTKIHRHERAIFEFKKSLKEKVNNPNSLSLYYDCLYSLSDVCFTYKLWEESFKYASLAIKHFNPQKDPIKCMVLHSIIAGHYVEEKKYDNVIREYQKGIDIAEKHDKCYAIELYSKQAKRYSDKKDFINTEKVLKRGLWLMDSCTEKQYNKLNFLKSLYYVYVNLGKYKEAVLLDEEINRLDSQEYRNTRNEKLDSLEIFFGTKIKDQKNLELEKANLIKSKELERQWNIIFLSGVCIVFVLIFIFVVFSSRKKLKKKNEELERQKKLIELKNLDLNRFDLLNRKIFGVISHDFRGPIITLKLLLENHLKDEQANDDFKKYGRDVINQLEHCNNILDSLLDWAKAEMKFDGRHFVTIDVKNYTETFITELSTYTNKKNIQIINNIPDNVFVDFNVFVFKIVFRNILLNAIKFSHANSFIKVFYDKNSVVIKDYGIGIAQEKIDKLFKDKMQTTFGTEYEYGFGIGLYLCYKLMKRNNGVIVFENNIPTGAIFKIVFPLTTPTENP